VVHLFGKIYRNRGWSAFISAVHLYMSTVNDCSCSGCDNAPNVINNNLYIHTYIHTYTYMYTLCINKYAVGWIKEGLGNDGGTELGH
jgi:hypothetical protein